MSEYVCRADEFFADRPFANPERTGDDLAVMARIAAELRALTSGNEARALEHFPGIIYRHGADGAHRFVINHMRALRQRTAFTLVGFFGHRHRDVDSTDLDEADALLLAELRAHAGMLAYCSYQYCADQYGNLVVFADAEAQAHWSRSEHHAHIAAAISPQYYSYIRLHNGALTGRLSDEHVITLHKTKYFDYRNGNASGVPWRGVRFYAPVGNP
jgi:hypothetical protein